MRIGYSDEVRRLESIVKPYLVIVDMKRKVDDNAPEDIKNMYQELLILRKKEYKDAYESNCM